ncbi:hypothetical protein [Nocardioides caricicola]|uniref:Uncharacterized protein n=1 Tax=Nocardioides caricicola TaxID=634770 RepID=A0ABW0MW53_9ACTN
MAATPSQPIPDAETVVKALHAVSDHGYEGIWLDGPGCACRNQEPQVREVLELFYGTIEEPDGVGAVVMNPFIDNGSGFGLWVRSAHPRLPWHVPAEASPQQWEDPTTGDWYTFEDLPRPLLVQSPGWVPPEPSTMPSPPRDPGEPFGIGAVVVDAANETWVRIHDCPRPWQRVDTEAGKSPSSEAEKGESTANWIDLTRPVIRSHGWNRP